MSNGIELLPAVIPASQPQRAPNIAPDRGEPGVDKPYIVIVYNDDYHTFEQVIGQLQKAIGCSQEKGEAFALDNHTTGRAVVFAGAAVECERVAVVLREIKLQVETDRA